MTKVLITVEIEDGSPNADPDHSTGLTNEAFERLSGYTAEHGAGSLMWLGEIEEVEKSD